MLSWAGGTRAVGHTGGAVGPSPFCPRCGAGVGPVRRWRSRSSAPGAAGVCPLPAPASFKPGLRRAAGLCGVPPAPHVGSARLQENKGLACAAGGAARRGTALLPGPAAGRGVTLVVLGTVFFRGCLPVLEEFGGAVKLWLQARSARLRAARTALGRAGGPRGPAGRSGAARGPGVRVPPPRAARVAGRVRTALGSETVAMFELRQGRAVRNRRGAGLPGLPVLGGAAAAPCALLSAPPAPDGAAAPPPRGGAAFAEWGPPRSAHLRARGSPPCRAAFPFLCSSDLVFNYLARLWAS